MYVTGFSLCESSFMCVTHGAFLFYSEQIQHAIEINFFTGSKLVFSFCEIQLFARFGVSTSNTMYTAISLSFSLIFEDHRLS